MGIAAEEEDEKTHEIYYRSQSTIDSSLVGDVVQHLLSHLQIELVIRSLRPFVSQIRVFRRGKDETHSVEIQVRLDELGP
jgi:hypothetical protein